VDDDGLVDSSSLLFRVIVALDSLAVPGPHQAFMALLEDPQTEVLLKGLCLLTVGGPGIGYSGVIGSDTGPAENSSLNFEVRAVAASGQSVPQVLAAVDRLQGLPAAKAAFRGIVAREQMTLRRSRAGLNGPIPARHYVFAGNPGTGKTTVARLLVDVLHASGTMPDAHLVETNRADLVGEFVGSSALKTRKMVEAALGGVLFIDEAYALAGYGTESPDRFAQEAVDTLVKLMEDYRDDLVVVLAGYPEQMSRMLAMNPGLRSRISRILVFDDLDDDQLVDTFTTQVIDAGYRPGPDVEVLVRAVLAATVRDESFGNARWTRNLLEAAIEAHALRLLDLPDAEDQDLQTLTFADVQQAAAAL
jgi:SpoVK/Ycf46/Vps4 family AAA+-type ATPase